MKRERLDKTMSRKIVDRVIIPLVEALGGAAPETGSVCQNIIIDKTLFDWTTKPWNLQTYRRD